MRKILFGLLLAVLAGSPSFAANVDIPGLPAAGSVTGTDVFECSQAGTSRKCTAAQSAAYVYGLTSGDATVTGLGAVTFATVNGNVGSFGSTTNCVSLTVNAKGLITAASAATCAPAVGSVTGLGTGVATFLATPSSANLLAALTTKTGTGNAVFGSAPTIDSLNATTAMTLAFLTGGGTQCLQVSNTGVVSATGSACGSGGGTGANPTGTAGPTAVNGVATTFLRSDGAPAVQLGTNAQKGIVQVDGTTITASSGVIAAVNTGTVTSVATTCGVSGGTITGTGILSSNSNPNVQTGANYPIVTADCGSIVYLNNGSNQAPTIAQAGTTGFAKGFYVELCNIGAGTQTITPTTSTIGGAATYVLAAGSAAAPKCIGVNSDGTNYVLDLTGPYSAPPTLGTNVSAALANTLSSAGGVTSTIASGTSALGTSAIGSAACATAVTTTATNTATTDVVLASFNGDPTAVTGYVPLTTGMLTIIAYPTSGNVNFKVCNNTSSSITPGAITLNWRVVR